VPIVYPLAASAKPGFAILATLSVPVARTSRSGGSGLGGRSAGGGNRG
jgi:hypothetical protein